SWRESSERHRLPSWASSRQMSIGGEHTSRLGSRTRAIQETTTLDWNGQPASASAAIIAMAAAFRVVALKRVNRAIVVGACVTALYGYSYMLLKNEDYALLIGAIG